MELDNQSHLQETLKHFYERASQAEQLLSKLVVQLTVSLEQVIDVLLVNSKSNLNHIDMFPNQNEDRLAKLEAAVASKKDTGNEGLVATISELRSKLDEANTQLGKRDTEIAKLQYRILHLVRALRDDDVKLEEMNGRDSSSTADAISKLKI
ncbi:hypothetical protein ACFE04_029939 [Oxalis oulophora]